MRYIYMVRAGSDHYKVGVAANVSDRIKALQTSNGHAIELVMCRRVVAAQQLEKLIHESLKAQKLNGGGKEWFVLTPQQAVDLAVKINGTDLVEVTDVVRLQDAIEDVNANQDVIYKMMEELVYKFDGDDPSKRGSKPQETPEKIKRLADKNDELYEEAVGIVTRAGHASASMLQRRMRVGYARAARLLDELQGAGVVGPADGARPRQFIEEADRKLRELPEPTLLNN